MTIASAIKQILLLAFLQKGNNYDAEDIKYANHLKLYEITTYNAQVKTCRDD